MGNLPGMLVTVLLLGSLNANMPPQFQLGSPPPPMFQPQPSCKSATLSTVSQTGGVLRVAKRYTGGGLDFYNAHAINPDPYVPYLALTVDRDRLTSRPGPSTIP